MKTNNRYFELVQQCPLRPIQSEEELDDAIRMVDVLLSQQVLQQEEQDYLEILSNIVERYEAEEYPIASISDSAMLHHLIDAKGVTVRQVAEHTGIVDSTIFAILNGKRNLSRDHIGKVAKYFSVSPNVFTF